MEEEEEEEEVQKEKEEDRGTQEGAKPHQEAVDVLLRRQLRAVAGVDRPAVLDAHRGPGAYNCPPFGSTSVHSVEKECTEGLLKGCLWGDWEVSGGIGGIQEYQGVFRVYFVTETAHVEQRSG